jgi:4-amino-4-deoxy-L-arabinose transferase-like glycosyltransferase
MDSNTLARTPPATRLLGMGSRSRAWLLGDAEAAWARPALLGLLALTTLLYLWGLGRSGNANDFYSAAVQAGTKSWKAFFFGSFDAANYITVDKPPASLWVMELSGRIFGFSSWSMLTPQALEGVAAVALLYATVRRWFSPAAALLSGAILAITPVAALMFRFNNPDALLVLLMVAGGYATTRALERASTRWLALAGAAIGLAFLAKMFQAFLVVPALALVYLIAAPTSLRRRIGQLLVAGAALVASAGWWVAIVALTPAADRPYVGGSTNNSILDLIWGYNGVGRIDGGSGGGPGGGGGGPRFSGAPGATRLFNSLMGGQISWLLPASLIALGGGLWLTRRAPRTDRRRAALILWGGWLVVGAAVYSFASGIIHTYYTNTVAPAIGALVGITVVALWQRRGLLLERLLLAAMLGSTAIWSYVLLDRTPAWHPWLRFAVVAGGLAEALAIAAGGRTLPRAVLASAAVAGLVAALAGPLAYTLSTVASSQRGAVVSAGPFAAGGRIGFGGRRPPGFSRAGMPQGAPPGAFSANGAMPTTPLGSGRGPIGSAPLGGRGGGFGGATTSKALTAYLAKDAGRYTWIVATGSSQSAAPIQLSTGDPVMAIGGFTGSDDAITLARFEQLVAAGKIHYYVAGGLGGGLGVGTDGRGAGSASIGAWVANHFSSTTVDGTTVYDLTEPS